MDKLTPQQVVMHLTDYQKWRRYDGELKPYPMPHTPKKLGEIIDQAMRCLPIFGAKQIQIT